MKLFAVFLVGVWMCTSLDAQTYTAFEREDVSKYRQRYTFELPPLPKRPVEISPVDISVQPYFTDGNKIHIEADARLLQLVESHIAASQNVSSLPGYRVQIFAGSSRSSAEGLRTRFLSRYPQTASYLSHRPPTYRVRVGNFMTREEAIRFSRDVKVYFPDAFVVEDQISPPRAKAEDED